MVRNDIKKEFGDYQTPGYFAVKVCNLLKDKLKISPAVVRSRKFSKSSIKCFR